MNIAISSLDVGEILKREEDTNTNSSFFYDSDLIKDRSKRRTFALSFFSRVLYTAAGNSSSMESTKNNDGANGNGKDLSVVGALTLSVVSSVSIVIVNKYLISTLEFQYVTFLTAMHMIVTAVALRFAAKYNFLEPKEVERQALLRFSCINGISIAFLNLSLGFNSVGFYQMTKLAIIPCTVMMHTIYYGKKYSSSIKGALGILLLGVGIATVTDMQLNLSLIHI